MENKVERWLEKRSQDIKEEWEINVYCECDRKCESPIEKLFLIEWYYQNEMENYHIFPQYKIDDYRVDFLAWYDKNKHCKEKSLIIELDSYLWHGSKPEQFAEEKERERELKRNGYNLMRFSGREIFKDVEKCVEEVIEYFANIKHKTSEKYEKETNK